MLSSVGVVMTGDIPELNFVAMLCTALSVRDTYKITSEWVEKGLRKADETWLINCMYMAIERASHLACETDESTLEKLAWSSFATAVGKHLEERLIS